MDIKLLWEIPARTLAIYVVVLIGLRLTGKRQIGQMTPFDLVLLLLIANAVQNAMTGTDTSVPGGVLAAVTLLAANALIGYARIRFPSFRHAVEGQPTVLIRDGKLLPKGLRREEMTEDELLAGLREHGVENVGAVALATLEIDGSISVVPAEAGHLQGRRRAVRFIKARS